MSLGYRTLLLVSVEAWNRTEKDGLSMPRRTPVDKNSAAIGVSRQFHAIGSKSAGQGGERVSWIRILSGCYICGAISLKVAGDEEAHAQADGWVTGQAGSGEMTALKRVGGKGACAGGRWS